VIMKAFIRPILICLMVLVTPALQAAPSITAQIHPAEVPLGQSAQLSVQVNDARGGSFPAIPEVKDLKITSAGQSSQFRIINGQTSTTIDYSFRVTPQKAGDYEIPIISVIYKGQVLKTPALKLRALPAGSQPKSAPAIADKDLAFLKLEFLDENLAKRNHLYVGETTPIAIHAFICEKTRLNNRPKPTLSSQAYTLESLSERYKESSQVIDGVRYHVLTWFAGLTGVKAGDHDFKAELETTLGIPQQSNRGNQRNRRGGFNDPFFNSFFARYEPREVTLESEASDIEVRSLPQNGRPENFSGAIGVFTLNASGLPSELQTGDPVTFKAVVDGQGTFDRMSAPTLEPVDLWKTYEAKGEFKGKDIIGFRGSKTFELPAIAREPGTHEVAFSLPYFDPQAGEYRIARTGNASLTITGDAIAAETAPAETSQPTPENKSPLMSEIGRIVSNSTPLHQRTWFRVTQIGLLGTTVLTTLFLFIRGREKDPKIAIERALRANLADHQKRAAAAVARKDSKGFFRIARSALSLQAAHLWGGNPEAITHADILNHCAPESNAARVFETASDLEYSGLSIADSDLAEWNRTFKAALEELKNPRSLTPKPQCAHWGQVSQSA